MIRNPSVAGKFYFDDPRMLNSQVEKYIDTHCEKKDCIGIVSPHAGFVFSGPVAGSVYSHINIPDTVILLGPNHTGLGEMASLMSSGEWIIPTGTISIDEVLSSALIEKTALLSEDSRAHMFEHSLEVQLPFIYYFRRDVKIVPIVLMRLDIDECMNLGKSIAEVINAMGRTVLLVASSDMSHYVPDDTARRLDKIAIDRILDIDPEGLYDVIMKNNITMCGYIPVTVMLFAARYLGAREAELIRYATSAEKSGDYDHVVGYAGMMVR
ncbi:MAG TPA: AmmeMemoRadiSam system protein B [Nitrospirae bacterium]|nr:AmmeMemoRadiSam system protein B [Nitrospirota bacterium]